MEFVESKSAWIAAAKTKLERVAPRQIIEMPYSTRRHQLRLNPAATNKISSRIAADQIVVTYPAVKQYTDDDVQEGIRQGIEKAWAAEAKECLPGRLSEFSQIAGLPYRKITVRNTVGRWGSCSGYNDISLSLHLMRLPDHLIDYVLLHELCHVAHKNHGPKFHDLLDRLTSGCHQSLRKELRQYNPRW